MSVRLERADEWGYDILVDGEVVGYIEGRVDYITQIDVLDDHQRNGYGMAAVERFVERARRSGAESVETSAVVSTGMEKIVQRLGFEQCEDDPSHWRLQL